MKRIHSKAFILLVLLFTGTFYSQDTSAQEVREFEPFEGIGIAVHADVFYTQGNGQQIKIEGRSQDIEDLITEVENGMQISTAGRRTYYRFENNLNYGRITVIFPCRSSLMMEEGTLSPVCSRRQFTA